MLACFVDDRTDLEMAAHWQRAAASVASDARYNMDKWPLLTAQQQDEAASLYALARKLMKIE